MDDKLNIKWFNGLYIMRSKTTSMMPRKLTATIKEIGLAIRIARLKRQWTLEEFAEKCRTTRQTVSKLENGDSSVSFALVATALYLFGMEKLLKELANPNNDTKGNTLVEIEILPKRVRKSKQGTKQCP